jgi:hypothetical protein
MARGKATRPVATATGLVSSHASEDPQDRVPFLCAFGYGWLCVPSFCPINFAGSAPGFGVKRCPQPGQSQLAR